MEKQKRKDSSDRSRTAGDKTEGTTERSQSVKLRDFTDHVCQMSVSSNQKFSDEFEELWKMAYKSSSTVGDLPLNRGKNRYGNIVPYDHSRVKLAEIADERGKPWDLNVADFQNRDSPGAYIATQGPLENTRNDFWRMIWKYNPSAIVALSGPVEDGWQEFDHYWPYDANRVAYGDVKVAVVHDDWSPEWSIRELSVSSEDLPTRTISQFHFTGWPDYGVPSDPATLTNFLLAFREQVPRSAIPVVVHCSAGVGRTGSFIALDRLVADIKTHDSVDVFGAVVDIRKDRMWMVQTEEQYRLIHLCLLRLLVDGADDVPCDTSATGPHET